MININQTTANVSSAFINMPNGHIFQSQLVNTGNLPAELTNNFGKLLYKGNDGNYKFIGPQKRNILEKINNQSIYSAYSAVSGSEGFSSSIPGIKSSLGKTIYSSIWGACEITSVKGFYSGIKHFNYNPDTDSDIYDIPSDISNLPTSLWNSYFNKPR